MKAGLDARLSFFSEPFDGLATLAPTPLPIIG
jgi:hypothetical protein